MNWQDERAAFETRVKDNFSTCPVQFPGVPLTPPNNGVWAKMQLLPSTSQRITLGPDGLFREYGVLLFQLFGPQNAGTADLRDVADELTTLFREARFSYNNSGLIRCYVPALHDRGATPDGNWYQLNLYTNYQRDVTLA